jgi:hypothetical protein
VVLDVERPQPALLAHCQGDKAAKLDKLGLAEVPVQPLPELVGRSYSASVNDVAIGHGENDRLNRVR